MSALAGLTEARDTLRDLLVKGLDGIQVFAFAPPKVTPPFVYVAPNEPYLSYEHEDAAFGSIQVRFQVGAVVKAGVTDARARQLDELVLQLLGLLAGTDFVVETVDRPGPIAIPGGSEHLAAPLNVSTVIHPDDDND